jgi:uncharacterized protein (UPF0335 family)
MSESNARNPDQSKDWIRQIMTQQRKADEENAVLRNLYKRAKSAGENVKAIRRSIQARRLVTDEAISEERDNIFYMRLQGIPLVQGDLFAWDIEDTDASRHEDDIWSAGNAGYVAGYRGTKEDECPYPADTDLASEWRNLWVRGKNAFSRANPDSQMADPSRARPGRKRAAEPVLLPYEEPEARPKRKVSTKPRKTRKDKGSRKTRRNGPSIDPSDGAVVY